MTRTGFHWLILAMVAGPCQAQAQSSVRPADRIVAPDPLEAKEIARARFELAYRSDPRPSQSARREAAHQAADSRLLEFLAGRGTHPFLQDATTELLAARLALAANADERFAALQECLIRRLIIEHAYERWFERGRIPRSDLLEARYFRLQSAAQWSQARAAGGSPLSWGGPRLARFYLDSEPWEQFPLIHPIDYRNLARAMQEGRQLDIQEAARGSVEIMRSVQEDRQRSFLDGRGTFEFLLTASERLLASELLLCASAKERTAALESHWLRCRQYQMVSQARFDAGRIRSHELAEAMDYGAEAEITWRRAQPDGSEWLSVSDAHGPLATQRWAKARWQAARTELARLALTRVAAARDCFTDRAAEFEAGRGTFDFLLAAARRLRDAELAVSGAGPAQRAAWERYWRQLVAIEEINRARADAGRIPVKEYNQVRAARLTAEQRLLGDKLRD